MSCSFAITDIPGVPLVLLLFHFYGIFDLNRTTELYPFLGEVIIRITSQFFFFLLQTVLTFFDVCPCHPQWVIYVVFVPCLGILICVREVKWL